MGRSDGLPLRTRPVAAGLWKHLSTHRNAGVRSVAEQVQRQRHLLQLSEAASPGGAADGSSGGLVLTPNISGGCSDRPRTQC